MRLRDLNAPVAMLIYFAVIHRSDRERALAHIDSDTAKRLFKLAVMSLRTPDITDEYVDILVDYIRLAMKTRADVQTSQEARDAIADVVTWVDGVTAKAGVQDRVLEALQFNALRRAFIQGVAQLAHGRSAAVATAAAGAGRAVSAGHRDAHDDDVYSVTTDTHAVSRRAVRPRTRLTLADITLEP